MKRFHFCAYNESVGLITDTDINAAEDEIIQVRNSHLIFSEPYRLLGITAIGSLLSRLRFANMGFIYRGIQHIWPLNVSAAIPTLPVVQKWMPRGIPIPMNEEITLQGTTTAIGPSDVSAGLWIAKDGWQPVEPTGEDIGWIRATVVIAAGAEAAWTTPVAIALERDLFNGVYAVVGAQVVAANALFFRMQFRTNTPEDGRTHRPGGFVQDTANLNPWEPQSMGLGEWGRFATYELPSIQTFDDTAGGTYEVRLRLKYLGENIAALYG